jgi:hypothetical protein
MAVTKAALMAETRVVSMAEMMVDSKDASSVV